MRLRALPVAAVLTSALSGPATAATIIVPTDQPTIMLGILAAQDGDEVLVLPGWYPETIDFLGKAITVRSQLGPNLTTIDGSAFDTSVVTCVSGEQQSTVLEGFFITEGRGTWQPDGFRYGLAMYIEGSSPVIDDCIFMTNLIDDPALGGAIANIASSPEITNCLFHENTAQRGGAIYNQAGSAPLIDNCRFEYNFADAPGGATGGAIASYGSRPTITRSVFMSNLTAPGGRGGGCYSTGGANGVLINCLFYGNSAFLGGGLSNEAGTLTLTNCTFSDNDATAGEAIHANTTTATNCIFWEHAGSDVTGIGLIIRFSDVTSAFPGIGNISLPPVFNPDYSLAAASPCIDAGNNNADTDIATPGIQSIPGVDLDSAPRFMEVIAVPDTGIGMGAIIDMGCLEHPGIIILAQSQFRRGDANGDGSVNIADVIFTTVFLFEGGVEPGCADAADSNDDGQIDLADAVLILAYLFDEWSLPAPFPDCGLDETDDDLGCEEESCP